MLFRSEIRWSKGRSVKKGKPMSRNQIKFSSLTAIAIVILFNLIMITRGLTADPADYMIINVEMNNPADFDRNLLESLRTLDNAAGNHIQTGVVAFHLPDGNEIKTVMSIEDTRKVLNGEIRYSDFISKHITIL